MSVPEAWSPVTAWVLFLLVVSQVPRTCLQSHSCYGLWTWCTVKEHLTLVPLQPPLFFFLYFPLYLWVYNTICSWVFCKFIPRKQHFFFNLSLRIILCFSSIPDLCLELLTLGPCEAHKVKAVPHISTDWGLQGLRAAQWRRTLGYWCMKKLIMTWQSGLAAQKDNCSWGCIKSGVATRSREVILYSTLIQPPPGALHPVLRSPMKDWHIKAGYEGQEN